MANKYRLRYGNNLVIPMPVASASVIEVGDNVAIKNPGTTDTICGLAEIADAGDAAANREAGGDQFVGIAVSASKNGDTDDVLVVKDGVVNLTQKTAAAIDFGDPVEPYADDNACEDQTVVEGSTSPIATCIKTHDNTTTETLCLLLPSKILGTPQG